MQNSPADIVEIYHKYTQELNDKNREKRYDGKEHWYHASGAGSCSRKLYYESVEKAKPSNPLDERTLRLLRLGTMVHDDFEKALHVYNTSIYNKYNKLGNKEKETKDKEKEIFKFHTEWEITIKELNVRGFYDIVAEGEEVYLYDLKTCASYSWKLKFGKKPFNTSIQYELQLGTYGLAIQEKFGRLDGMYLYYYNKDNSDMRPVSVPLLYVSRAYMFWKNINDEHKQGLPQFRKGVSPVQAWQCKYCQFLDHCNPPR